MQCNQAFCETGFTNGPFCSSYSTPLSATQNMYPEIVGEGHITSVTLPDGSVQFFFMPTLKWWSPNATQCHPYSTIPNPMFANTNYNIPPLCNNNIGTWFIRSISNPCPQSVCNSPSQRNELLSLANNTDCNHKLNSHDFGYQVKFHNDGWTSTTDLVYFYPSLRQRDFVFTPPCKDKTVQIDTKPIANNTVCDHEVVCTKPCICSVGAKPMSLDCLVDPNLTPKSNNTSTDDSCCSKKLNKRGMVHKKKRSKSKNNTVCDHEVVCTKPCICSVGAKPMSLDCLVDPNLTPKSNNTSTDDSCCSKKLNKRGKVHKKKRSKSKNIICACGPTANIASVDKSITTYADEGSSCTPADGRETQTCKSEESKCVDAKPMKKSLLKQFLLKPKLTTKTYSSCSTTDECSNDDASKAPNKRDEAKEYRRSKPKKCDCCSDSSLNSVCSVSGDETVASKDTPCTCSTCSSITMLKKSKTRSKGAEQRTSSVQNTSLQWFKSDNCVCDKCEPKGEETRETSVCPSSERATEGKFSEDLLGNCSHDCDTVASTCR